MNIEKWVSENDLIDQFSYMEIDNFIEIIKILNKTHAIVPREPSEDITFNIWDECTSGFQMDIEDTRESYLAAIKAAENEQ